MGFFSDLIQSILVILLLIVGTVGGFALLVYLFVLLYSLMSNKKGLNSKGEEPVQR